tara:strand:+ start:92 stop:1153 length:1062 start_codon:yes stop_codon:yes gene_type:complete
MSYFDFLPYLSMAVCGVLFLIAMWRLKNMNSDEKYKLNMYEDLIPNIKQISDATEGNISKDIDTNKQFLIAAVKDLKEVVEKNGERLHSQDKELGKMTEQLKPLESLTEIQKVLTNSSKRGQFGEWSAEGLLEAYGLQEGVHFYTQKQMDGEKKRPDFTIMLPENKKVNMDSKFPHVNYANMTSEDDPERKEKYGKEFLKDVKEHIKQLSGKEYVNPQEGTLDFVIMYLPVDGLYMYLLQKDSSIIEFANEKNVQICSPTSLGPMLRIVRSAIKSIYMKEQSQEIIKSVNNVLFQMDYYIKEQDKLGAKIYAAADQFEVVTGKRTRLFQKSLTDLVALPSAQESLDSSDADRD